MQNLLTLTLIVEPDRQRLARFVMDAVQALGGNLFASAHALETQMRRLREDAGRERQPIEATLSLRDDTLCLAWLDWCEPLIQLKQPPTPDALQALASRLKNASESTDSTLLKRRNEQIIADLEAAKQRARREIEEFETLLELKQNELSHSIRAAQIDALTALYNRSGYDTRLREAFLRCQQQGEELCLLLLDLDHFKQVNDTHGHQHGDAYLKKMADAMRACVREHVDHACRMGGDEFAIVLYSDLEAARRVAHEILHLMERRVSIGIARMRENESIEALVARADAALYEAKHRGRGRVVTDETEDPKLKAVTN